MTPFFKSFLAIAALLVSGFIIGYAGTLSIHKLIQHATNAATSLPHRNPAQSWDQANLKAHDTGCPTAIFVAPNGDLVQCQYAQASAPAVKDDGPRYFKTMDEAAIYVVTKIYERSHYYEFGGVIVKSPKGYAISIPATQHHGMDVNFEEDPESFEFPIVATYHVHPCLKNAFSSVFSPQDLAGSRVTKTPGYVLDECTGAVHYWAPGDGYLDADGMLKLGVNPMALMQGVQLSPGRIIGHIAVDGVVLN